MCINSPGREAHWISSDVDDRMEAKFKTQNYLGFPKKPKKLNPKRIPRRISRP